MFHVNKKINLLCYSFPWIQRKTELNIKKNIFFEHEINIILLYIQNNTFLHSPAF